MDKLLGKTLEELRQICAAGSLPSYTASQLALWLYGKKVCSFDEMTNISKAARAYLSERFEVGRIFPCKVALSRDGTKKYLFEIKKADNSSFVEAVMIPDAPRATLCVSSQSGCRMGCRFCMTGRQGFRGNLDTAQILSQFFSIDEELTNAVFMGMGEPLDNYEAVTKAIEILTASWGCGWSPKRITLSTIGINRMLSPAHGGKNAGTSRIGDSKETEHMQAGSPLERFLNESKVHLAVSLHNPFPTERESIMPAEKVFPLDKTIQMIKQYDFTGQRRVSFEYIMFASLNDTPRHADALISKLKGLECRVNLIRFHDIGSKEFRTSEPSVIERFKDRLNKAGIITTIRASRGEDIEAACGMLSGKQYSKN